MERREASPSGSKHERGMGADSILLCCAVSNKDARNNKWKKKSGGHPAVDSGEDSDFLVQVCTTMRRLHLPQIVVKSPITVAYPTRPTFRTKW